MSPHLGDDAAALAVGALEPAERAAAEAHLATCPACAAEVRAHREVLAALADATAVDPPARLREAVLDAVRHEPQEPAPARPGPGAQPTVRPRLPRQRSEGARRSLRWLVAAAAAVVLIGVGSATWSVIAGQRAAQQAAQAQEEAVERVLAAPDATTVPADQPAWSRASVVVSASRDGAVLVATDLEPPPEGSTYELWFVESGQARPAGTFEGGDGTQRRALDGAPSTASAVAVTVEPDGGSPTPTSPPVATFALPGA